MKPGIFLFLSVGIFASTTFAKSRLPIRDFLGGYTENGVFHKGMGVESPGLLEIGSLSHSALNTVQIRVKTSEAELNALLKPFTEAEVKELTDLVTKKAKIPRAERVAGVAPNLNHLAAPEQTRLTQLLAKAPDPAAVEAKLNYVRRARVQYWLALEIMTELIKRSMTDFDLRAFEKSVENFKAILYEKSEGEESNQRDLKLKSYVLDQAGRLYLAGLKFLSLKQPPFPKTRAADLPARVTKSLEASDLSTDAKDNFRWLDWDIFVDHEADAPVYFLKATIDEIPVYANNQVMPRATELVQGFKAMLNDGKENSALINLDLNDPSGAGKEALAKEVLNEGRMRLLSTDQPNLKRAAGLVTFYLYCLDALVDSFNINTHDSFEIMRVAIYSLVRHVLDIDGNENLTVVTHQRLADGTDQWANGQVYSYRPFPKAMPDFYPIKRAVDTAYEIEWQIYWKDGQSGPHLIDAKADEANRRKEFMQYHGLLLRDIFGTDFSYFVWPIKDAYQGDWKKDPRTNQWIPQEVWKTDAQGRKIPEARNLDGSYLAEATDLQSGDVWAELGTGIGSELISYATQAAKPDSQVKQFVHQASIWGVAKEKMYNKWINTLSWGSSKLTTASDAVNDTPVMKWARTHVSEKLSVRWDVPPNLKNIAPGLDVNYSGLSHVGLVEVFGDDRYPQMVNANFIDAFPQKMRGQVWRAHGWGSNHSRKGAIFRLRPEIALEHRANIVAKIDAAKAEYQKNWQLLSDNTKLKARLTEASLNNSGTAQIECVNYLSTVRFDKSEWDNPTLFGQLREPIRPVFNFCMSVMKLRGLENFKLRIVDQAGSANLTGEALVRQMGELVVEVARHIRNQTKEYEGMGTHFDNNFDSLSWGDMYCSETDTLSYLRGTGLVIWEAAGFRGYLKKMLADLPSDFLYKASGGFDKVPYGPQDGFYAPQDIMLTDYGHNMFRPILITTFTVFGVNDE